MTDTSPTVFISCLGGSPRLFEHQAAALWQHGGVVMADHRHEDSIGSIAARILGQAPPRFDLVGISMGGYLAFEILRQAADRVTRLALLDTSATVDSAEAMADRIEQCDIARAGRFEEIAALQFPHVVHPTHRDDPARQAVFRTMLEETGPKAFVRQQVACLRRSESISLLASIRCPTVVIVGDADSIAPEPEARIMVDGIAQARLEVVRDCGHLSTLDQPERLTQILVDWKLRSN